MNIFKFSKGIFLELLLSQSCELVDSHFVCASFSVVSSNLSNILGKLESPKAILIAEKSVSGAIVAKIVLIGGGGGCLQVDVAGLYDL